MIGHMQDSLLTEMLNVSKRLVVEAAAIGSARSGLVVSERKADGSVVTESDHAIQAHVLRAVSHAYPDHAVLAEETLLAPSTHGEPTSARYCWVLDPIDGTRNYVSGFPCYATSIAVLDQGRPVVAVVFEHNTQRLYTAVAGGGGTLNDRPIRVPAPSSHADLLIGVPSSKDSLTVNVLRRWAGTKGLILRNLGAATVHLALVASGGLDAAFGKQSKIWDVAAGALLVTEAGGTITDPYGTSLLPFDLSAHPERDIPFLAGAPDAHAQLARSISGMST